MNVEWVVCFDCKLIVIFDVEVGVLFNIVIMCDVNCCGYGIVFFYVVMSLL